MKQLFFILCMFPSIALAQLEDKKGMMAMTVDLSKSGRSSSSTFNYSDFELNFMAGPVIKNRFSTGLLLGFSRGNSSYSSSSYSNEGKIKIFNYGVHGRYYHQISKRFYINGLLLIYASRGESEETNNQNDNYKLRGFTFDLRPSILFLTKSGIGIEASYPFFGYLVTKEINDDDMYDDWKDRNLYLNTIPGLISLTLSYHF